MAISVLSLALLASVPTELKKEEIAADMVVYQFVYRRSALACTCLLNTADVAFQVFSTCGFVNVRVF